MLKGVKDRLKVGQMWAYGGPELQHTASSSTQQNRPHAPVRDCRREGCTPDKDAIFCSLALKTSFFNTEYKKESRGLVKIVLHLIHTHTNTCMQNKTCRDRHTHTYIHTQAYNLKRHDNSSHIIPLFFPPKEECRVKTRKHFLLSQQI